MNHRIKESKFETKGLPEGQLKSSVLKQSFEGNLVPQDPNDEPTELTLKKIDNTVEFRKKGLPVGWITMKFENIKPHGDAFDPVKEKNEKYIGLEHLEKNTGRISGHSDSSTTSSTKTRFVKGDLLYGKLRPYLNKVAIAEFDGVCSTDILVFPQTPIMINKLLKFCLLKSDFVQFANNTVTGIQHPRTNHKKLSSYGLMVPPLPEQHRIVSKIESIFAQIDACRSKLEKLVSQTQSAQGSLAQLKSSVLKQAFKGKLVPQNPNDEPVKTLLKQFYKKSDNNLESENEWLPKRWTVAHLNEIGTIITGNTPSKKKAYFYGKHMPFFKPTDLNSAYYVTHSTDALSKQGLKKARLIPKRSVMITSIGATIGKVGFNRIDGATNQQINSIIPHSGIMWPEYLYFVCISPQFQKLLLTNASSTTLPIINKSRFSQLKIPLPPLAEQRRIVSKIESIFAKIDATDRLVKDSLRRLDMLRNSVLKQAFEGKLVPQDPNDEPAEVLLQRIKQEQKPKRNRNVK